MTTVELRDIVTDEDRAAVLRLERAPGQERFLGSMASHFEDAADDPDGKPRMWAVVAGGEVVGFVMISDGVEVFDEDRVYPFFLWRLLIDRRHQGRGYGSAAIEAVVDYLRDRPGADVLHTSTGPGDGSPVPFYEKNGFVRTGEIRWDEIILARPLRQDGA